MTAAARDGVEGSVASIQDSVHLTGAVPSGTVQTALPDVETALRTVPNLNEADIQALLKMVTAGHAYAGFGVAQTADTADAIQVVGLLAWQAGGELRIRASTLARFPPGLVLTRTDCIETGDVVFRAAIARATGAAPTSPAGSV